MTDKHYLSAHYKNPRKKNSMRLRAKRLGILKVDENGFNYVAMEDVPKLKEVTRLPARVNAPALAQLPPGLIKVQDLRRFGITNDIVARLESKGLLKRVKVRTFMDKVWAVDRDELIQAILKPPASNGHQVTAAERAALLRSKIASGCAFLSQNEARNLLHTSWKYMQAWCRESGAIEQGKQRVNLSKLADYLEELWAKEKP